MTAAQHEPIGPHPDVATSFVCSLMWSIPTDTVDVLKLVDDNDIHDAALAAVLAAVRALATNSRPPSPQLVADELRRTGRFKGLVPDRLRAATTAGAAPQAARQYGAAVVAEALRRRVESHGTAMVTAAADAAEPELASLVTAAAKAVAATARRLGELRGEAVTA